MTDIDTDTYELAYGRHIRPGSGEEFVPGEPFEPTERERGSIGHRLLPVEGESFDADDVLDDTVENLKPAIQNGEYDGHLDALKEAEQAGEDRITLIEALDSRASDV